MKPTPIPPPEGVSLLAFGAHPDDVEFGAGGVIARETRSGRAGHIVVCSRGESGTNGTPGERTAEAEKGAALLGVGLEFIELGGDTRIEPRLDHVLTLATLIRKWRPTIVLAPTPVDNQHPDHGVVGRLVRDAARLARYGGIAELKAQPAHAIGQLLFYALSTEGEPAGQVPLLMDVSTEGVVATWTAAMEAHASQMRTRNYVELQLTRARLHGLRAGVSHAIALWPNDPPVFASLEPLARGARQF